ncbi:MAG: DNA-methyltransferase, partial [Pyrinomonadaceae bacterium]
MSESRNQFEKYIKADSFIPLFLCGDALQIIRDLPDESIDFCMTSPPYWNKREYKAGGIGLEDTYEQYIGDLLLIFNEIRRALKNTGSFWLNIGDTYSNKSLVGIPWRVALKMMDEQRWTLRNSVIWNKIKGPDNSKDKLRNVHEHVFHFVKHQKNFYYDVNAIRSKPREARVKNGAVISATGVTGVRYKRQIELSTSLSPSEKEAAFQTLNATLASVARGELSDFRMVIRNQQRTTHSNSEAVSGRAKELVQKGFYILKYHPDGSKPNDVWEIIPEDTSGRSEHYAAYPEDLCKIPILATCPPDGVVLDPFCGTG